MIKLDFVKKVNSNLTLRVKKDIDGNEFIAIFGESGAGKTTILRVIAGLEKPDFGKIVVDDEIWLIAIKI